MKSPQILLLLLLVAALAGAGGWFVAKHSHPPDAAPDAGVIYTCSMHPQVRSMKPGFCPFCGMALAPLNQVNAAGLSEGAVMLSSNRVNAINILTVEARRQPLRRTLRVAGVIDDNDARHRILSAYVDGRIDRLFVNFTGAEVTEGQPLASIYSPTLLAAEREYVALVKRKPAGEAPAMHEEHEKFIDGARQRLRRLGLTAAQIAALPDKPSDAMQTEILAPLGGTVVSRAAYEGQYVKEGDKLFELADFSTMWFRFDAYERDLAWLKPGQSVEVTTPSSPDRTYIAPITFIDPNLNDPTRSAEIPNPLIETNGPPHRALLHRLFGEGIVKVDAPDVLAVPRSAVLAPGRPYVFVDKGGGTWRGGTDQWLQITYKGPGGAKILVQEGAFCTGGLSLCSPRDTVIGTATFGSLPGSLDALGPAPSDGYAIYIDPGTRNGYTITGTGMSQDAFTAIAAALVKVPRS